MAKSVGSDAGVEAAIDRLYEGPLDRFTAGRNELAAALKKSGDADGAARVKALTKPSATAWAVNQVWWRQRDRFQAMLDAGRAQRQAHVAWAKGRPADVRSAGDARHAAVQEVTDAAVEALGGRKAVAPDVQYRIAGTVEALASSGVPAGETPGRLTRDLQSSGLDALGALAAAAGAVTRPTLVTRQAPDAARRPSPPASSPEASPVAGAGSVPPAGETARQRKAREAEEAAARARATALARARTRLAEIESAAALTTRAADEAAAEEARLRTTLETLTQRRVEREAALDEARAEEAAGRRALSAATAAASRTGLDRARAARDVARAREALDQLESHH